MTLKTEKIIIGENEIEIKETSFGAQLRLQSLDKVTFEDVYKASISEEDFKKLGTFDNLTKDEGKLITQAYERVNRKNIPSEQL